jgi:hypothetical protein
MRTLLLLVPLALVGCVHTVVRPFDQAKDAAAHGVRFYRPAPYLWLASDDKGKCIPTIVYLPDPRQQFIMQVSPLDGSLGIGTASMKPTLQDGWNLTALEATVDTKVPETLTAIAGLVSAARPAPPAGPGKLGIPLPRPGGVKTDKGKPVSPGLYRIDLNTDPHAPSPLEFVPVLEARDQNDQPIPCATLGTPSQPPSGGGKDKKP